MRPYDGRANNSAAFEDAFEEALLCAFRLRPVVLCEFGADNLGAVAVRLARVRFIHTDVRELRMVYVTHGTALVDAFAGSRNSALRMTMPA